MRNEKQFQGWRSEQIVKVFLLSSGLFDVTESYSNSDKGVDFIAIYKERNNRRFDIEVKATKYSKSEIQRKYPQKKYNSNSPTMQFYVNYDKETGYFRLTNTNYTSELNKMVRENFIYEVKNYAQQYL